MRHVCDNVRALIPKRVQRHPRDPGIKPGEALRWSDISYTVAYILSVRGPFDCRSGMCEVKFKVKQIIAGSAHRDKTRKCISSSPGFKQAQTSYCVYLPACEQDHMLFGHVESGHMPKDPR